ncbi:MAG: VOC family protein [Alphaproteobacteria bacterium]|jgi:methylmalonyl-CoA/ethylmalonyl-CoA epimerase|nr:VOC family protein [Alphaproteobacteria bacterium]
MTRKISHIGILVHDADAAVTNWTEAFGLKKFEDRRIEVEGIRSVFISVGGSWDEMVIEIMEPLDKADMENALSRRLAKVGEGFYHICLEVDDVEGSAEALRDRGMTVLMRDPTDAGASPRWLVHPKDANGVMVEAVKR